jgi:hypothetical protein
MNLSIEEVERAALALAAETAVGASSLHPLAGSQRASAWEGRGG